MLIIKFFKKILSFFKCKKIEVQEPHSYICGCGEYCFYSDHFTNCKCLDHDY